MCLSSNIILISKTLRRITKCRAGSRFSRSFWVVYYYSSVAIFYFTQAGTIFL